MKETNKIALPIIVVILLILVLGAGAYIIISNNNKANNEINSLKNQILDLQKNNVVEQNNNNTINSNNNSVNTNNNTNVSGTNSNNAEQIVKLEGTYDRKNDAYGKIVISNETSKGFKFTIDVQNSRETNIGNLEGTAVKFEDGGYEYTESNYRLTFILKDGGKTIEVKEIDGDESSSKYCGSGAYFDGTYVK